ncbi:MAG: cyclohexa-1,5-dienecarbonyl-CoA hydratase [Deltaproteobacteria bacterium]|nr:MAG: cyclohexa-1,5-dienecarbonyl-CoA hydratase [Deltaproteobacteria bacterium]
MPKIETHFEAEGKIFRITLNAPKGNVIDMAMLSEMNDAFDALEGAASVRCLLLDATGPHFSFGASVAEHRPGAVEEMLPRFHATILRLARLPLPVVSVVRGLCLGGAMELVSLSHWIFADHGASFGQPEIELGVFAPVASIVLPLKLGQPLAEHLCLTGHRLSAEEAWKHGFVHHVASDPGEAARHFIETELLPKSGVALRHALRAVRHDFVRRLEDSLVPVEKLYLEELMACHDPREGIEAFLEKRKPVWKDA